MPVTTGSKGFVTSPIGFLIDVCDNKDVKSAFNIFFKLNFKNKIIKKQNKKTKFMKKI